MQAHNPKELATIVKNYRKDQNTSQNTIASLAGIKQATISAFEKKPSATKLETLFRILSATNLELQIVPRNTSVKKAVWSEEW